MIADQVNPLERRLAHLELVALDSMEASVADFYRRIPPKRGAKSPWTPDAYPTGGEKELYAQFAHILLSAPEVTVPAMLSQFATSTAARLETACLVGGWRAYRISTIRFRRGSRWKGPMCLLGTAPPDAAGAIADVGLFLNPSYNLDEGQVEADTILYFEIKSAPHHKHSQRQTRGHLAALDEQTLSSHAFLAALGGKPVAIEHPRWLGHLSWNEFLWAESQVLADQTSNRHLVKEIEDLRLRMSCPTLRR